MDNHCTIGFYKNLVEQDFRRWYAYGVKYPNYVTGDFLFPFFFCYPKTTESTPTITKVEFYQIKCTELPRIGSGDFNIDFSSDFLVYGESAESWEEMLGDNGLSVRIIGDYVVVTYPAWENSDLEMDMGVYYMKFTMSDGVVRYSDIFVASADSNIQHRLIKVEWWNQENLQYANGVIPYGSVPSFKNVIQLDTEIGLPEYTYTEEGKDRDGYFFPIKQISEKTYHFVFHAPEYIIDSMRLIRMADRVKITDQMGVEYKCDTFEMEVEWLEQGHYARVDCAFQTDSVVKMIGKAYNSISDR